MINYSMELCRSLTLYTSESCNLQCSYCEINEYLDKKQHRTEAKKVKESLINGDYFNTLQIAFEKLNINPNNINFIDLWGQEPTLTLKEFEILFSKLYKELCPNISRIYFSTNGVAYIDNIFHFIQFLDKDVLNKSCTLRIQFSFDGYEQTRQHRGIEPTIILENIYTLLRKLQNIDLTYVKLEICPHNVLDKDTFIFFADEKNNDLLKKFLHDFEDLYNSLLISNKNKNISINPFWGGLETPLNGSIEDGKLLYSFVNQCNKVSKNKKFNMGMQLVEHFAEKMPIYSEDKLIPLLEEINSLYYIKNPNNLKTLQDLSRHFGCGYNSKSLKIRYDGTLLHCQNALFGLHQPIKNDINSKIQEQKLEKHFYPNIITDSDDVINNYLYQTFLKNNECFLPAYIQNCQFLKLLLNANQVKQDYNNINKFMQCAFFLTFMIPCPNTSMMYCGNTYGTYCGAIRLYCNGFMDLIFDNYKRRIENNDSAKR